MDETSTSSITTHLQDGCFSQLKYRHCQFQLSIIPGTILNVLPGSEVFIVMTPVILNTKQSNNALKFICIQIGIPRKYAPVALTAVYETRDDRVFIYKVGLECCTFPSA